MRRRVRNAKDLLLSDLRAKSWSLDAGKVYYTGEFPVHAVDVRWTMKPVRYAAPVLHLLVPEGTAPVAADDETYEEYCARTRDRFTDEMMETAASRAAAPSFHLQRG